MPERDRNTSPSSVVVHQGGATDAALEDQSDEAGPSAQTVAEQLAREYADIERATLALRKAPPAPETRRKAVRRLTAKPRSLWFLIGALWLSTALLTAGAVVAIASFAG